MFTRPYRKLQEEISGKRSMDYLYEVIRHHRIQVSPGIRQACEYARGALEFAGLEAETLVYPADGETRVWGQPPTPLEWSIQGAVLHLVSPEKEKRKLCDYAEEPLSVIQRSGPTPADGLTGEVLAVENADDPSAYEGVDVEGRFVLVDCDPTAAYRNAVNEKGALGIVTDHMPAFDPVRPRGDLQDALCYRSFWWDTDDEPCPGFVLTPREGARLRKLIGGDEPVKLHAGVQSSFDRGTMEVVSALIPGTGDEEVLIIAHICHPKPSANDNASGVAAAVEAARALARLISSGQLERPQRSIRFLLVPEMTGTYAFLAENEDHLDRYTAAVNLDMVGENQALCGSTLIAEAPPVSIPSFTGDLAALIMAHAGRDLKNLAGTGRYASFRHTAAPFSGGSDHYIASDPTVGIPSPMIIQWPDRFYHTSEDTPDKVDPDMLARVATITATYAYFTAAAGEKEALWLGAQMTARFPEVLRGAGPRVRDYLAAGREQWAHRLLDFLAERRTADLDSLGRLADTGDRLQLYREQVRSLVSEEKSRWQLLLEAGCVEAREEDDGEPLEQLPQLTPERLHPGPPSLGRLLAKASPEPVEQWRVIRKKHPRLNAGYTLALYWADGGRSLAEIRDLVELESGMDLTEVIEPLFSTLEELGVIRYR
ncbi:MAG: DUF4910 domain-containing protein [Bacillota bacterium]